MISLQGGLPGFGANGSTAMLLSGLVSPSLHKNSNNLGTSMRSYLPENVSSGLVVGPLHPSLLGKPEGDNFEYPSGSVEDGHWLSARGSTSTTNCREKTALSYIMIVASLWVDVMDSSCIPSAEAYCASAGFSIWHDGNGTRNCRGCFSIN
jgi:hypothetical protein